MDLDDLLHVRRSSWNYQDPEFEENMYSLVHGGRSCFLFYASFPFCDEYKSYIPDETAIVYITEVFQTTSQEYPRVIL